MFDPAFDRNYACLAEYAWNQTISGGLYQLKSRYAERVMGTTGFEAVEPFEKWDQVYDSMAFVSNTLDIQLPYLAHLLRGAGRVPPQRGAGARGRFAALDARISAAAHPHSPGAHLLRSTTRRGARHGSGR